MGRPTLLAAVALALAACSSSSGQHAATTSSAETTAAATTSGAATTSAAATSSAATTAAAATTAPGGPSSTTASPGSSTGGTAASPAASATVTGYFKTFQLALTAAEADCLAAKLDAATLSSLDDAVANGSEATDEASLDVFRALVVCEPKSYVDSQVGLIKENTKATQDEAVCVVHKANALFAADADLLALASGDQSTRDWPAADKDKLRTAIASCASSDLVDQIIESV